VRVKIASAFWYHRPRPDINTAVGRAASDGGDCQSSELQTYCGLCGSRTDAPIGADDVGLGVLIPHASLVERDARASCHVGTKLCSATTARSFGSQIHTTLNAHHWGRGLSYRGIRTDSIGLQRQT
jgi:hypothetical protein